MTILDDQKRFYAELWERYGEDPRALGHRDRATQYERFFRLGRAFRFETERFSVHEIGCGFGDFGVYLSRSFPRAVYSGSEICEEFHKVCRRRFPEGEFHLRDVSSSAPTERYDFVTQSGLFNGRFGATPEEWQSFVERMLETMFGMARKGISVNFLSTHGDAGLRQPELHYQSPQAAIDFVVEHLSRHYSIDAGGPLYEFTLHVYRPEYLRESYPDEAFGRYFPDRSSQ